MKIHDKLQIYVNGYPSTTIDKTKYFTITKFYLVNINRHKNA